MRSLMTAMVDNNDDDNDNDEEERTCKSAIRP